MTVKATSVSTIDINLEDVHYPFYLGYDILQELVAPLSRLEPDKLIVISDRQVWDLHRPRVLPALERVAPVVELINRPGEEAKSLGVLEGLLEEALRQGVTRNSVAVTVGGGVPGNLGGLFAALLFRGLRLVHVPTSVVAILDSVISLKQAVNSRVGKNLIGTYYRASFVLADIQFLSTLSERDFRSGVCEMIKNVLAIQPERIAWLRELLGSDYRRNPILLEEMIRAGVEAKLKVMAEDKYEKKRGIILEYGHTIGHAVELLDSQRQGAAGRSHGESIALGMMAAAMVSDKLGLAAEGLVQTHRDLIQSAGVTVRVPGGMTTGEILEILCKDNKRGYLSRSPGHVSMILLREPGEPVVSGSLPLYPVPVECIRRTLDELSVGTDWTSE